MGQRIVQGMVRDRYALFHRSKPTSGVDTRRSQGNILDSTYTTIYTPTCNSTTGSDMHEARAVLYYNALLSNNSTNTVSAAYSQRYQQHRYHDDVLSHPTGPQFGGGAFFWMALGFRVPRSQYFRRNGAVQLEVRRLALDSAEKT